MKIVITPNFFESIKDIGSWKNKWYSLLGWFKYHFNKENFQLMKVCWKGRPWDSGYLYELEQAKIKEMIAYHTKHKRYVGVEEDIKWMELCVELIDIFTEKKDLFHYTGKVDFVPIEGSDNYELKHGDDFQYHCDVKVNVKNAHRFVPGGKDNPHIEYWEKHAHEIYIAKAKHLYHKIREQYDGRWWD